MDVRASKEIRIACGNGVATKYTKRHEEFAAQWECLRHWGHERVPRCGKGTRMDHGLHGSTRIDSQ